MGLKVLGQEAPAADTDTDLFTATAAGVVSTLIVCNRGSVAAKFRVAVRPDGAAVANEHYIAYDIPVGAENIYPFTIGITFDVNDVITVRASTADLSFSAFGEED
ncbi:MAG: hypothetical protein WD432_00075 [Candidatus Saccharimonadales bacterium]